LQTEFAKADSILKLGLMPNNYAIKSYL